MRKAVTQIEPPPVTDAPRIAVPQHAVIDMLLNAIADEITDRLEYRQSTRVRLLNSEQAAEYLGISEDQLHNFVADGRLTPVRFDRRLRFDVRELDKLIESSKRRR